MSIKIVTYKLCTVVDVSENPKTLFIFGDNDCRFGKKGQSIIIDMPNTIGIRTKNIQV